MKRLIIITAALVLASMPVLAQSNTLTMDFAPAPAKGKLYKPDSGPAPHVGIFLMHRTADFLNHIAARELVKRGYLVLAMNSRFENNEAAVVWEDLALDVKTGVEYLKKQPGITKIVLFAHSGGGPTMSFYQAVAEKGPGYTQGANKLVQGDSLKLAGLPRADGIVFADAHVGIPINLLRGLNPALINEDTNRINPDLDALNPKNGFNSNGPSQYSAAFQKKYFEAQAQRMDRLIAAAQQQMKDGKGDEPFLIPGTGVSLANRDPSVNAGSLKPYRLLKNDGTIVTQIVTRVRAPEPAAGQRAGQRAGQGATRQLTARSFLSANAIRATDSMSAIDWCSVNSSTPCGLRQISVPVLISAMGAHTFIRDNEIHFEAATSADKEFIIIEGATHSFTPCRECETTPGQYSNSVKNYFDYVQKWINAKF